MKSFSNEIPSKTAIDEAVTALDTKHETFVTELRKILTKMYALTAFNLVITIGIVLFVTFHK